MNKFCQFSRIRKMYNSTSIFISIEKFNKLYRVMRVKKHTRVHFIYFPINIKKRLYYIEDCTERLQEKIIVDLSIKKWSLFTKQLYNDCHLYCLNLSVLLGEFNVLLSKAVTKDLHYFKSYSDKCFWCYINCISTVSFIGLLWHFKAGNFSSVFVMLFLHFIIWLSQNSDQVIFQILMRKTNVWYQDQWIVLIDALIKVDLFFMQLLLTVWNV